MGFSSEAHLDRLCNTSCGCDVGSGEERERETGRVGVIYAARTKGQSWQTEASAEKPGSKLAG